MYGAGLGVGLGSSGAASDSCAPRAAAVSISTTSGRRQRARERRRDEANEGARRHGGPALVPLRAQGLDGPKAVHGLLHLCRCLARGEGVADLGMANSVGHTQVGCKERDQQGVAAQRGQVARLEHELHLGLVRERPLDHALARFTSGFEQDFTVTCLQTLFSSLYRICRESQRIMNNLAEG